MTEEIITNNHFKVEDSRAILYYYEGSSTLNKYSLDGLLNLDIQPVVANISWVMYTSSNADILRIQEDGTVLVLGEGLVKITVESLLNRDIEDSFSGVKGIKYFGDNVKVGVDEIKLKLNTYGEELGITEKYLGSYISDLYLSKRVGTIFDGQELLEIKVKSFNIEDDLENFKKLEIPLRNNTFVKLEDICEFETVESLERLVKDDGETNFYVFANVDSSVITATEVLEKIAPTIEKSACVDSFSNSMAPMIFLRHKRNMLAHGNESFADSASAFSTVQLEQLKEPAFAYMKEVTSSFEQYLDDELFLVS